MPSPEQAWAIEVWRAGENRVCSAVAGSGKSTLLLHACPAPGVPVLVLQLEVEARLQAAGLPVEHQCRTFHRLCFAAPWADARRREHARCVAGRG